MCLTLLGLSIAYRFGTSPMFAVGASILCFGCKSVGAWSPATSYLLGALLFAIDITRAFQPNQQETLSGRRMESPSSSEEQAIELWEPNGMPALAVPFGGSTLCREHYMFLLENRLRELVQVDPARAKRLLTGSPENHPNLYAIAMVNPAKDWPTQITFCDQMQMVLDRIDWETGHRRTVQRGELPRLDELIEQL